MNGASQPLLPKEPSAGNNNRITHLIGSHEKEWKEVLDERKKAVYPFCRTIGQYEKQNNNQQPPGSIDDALARTGSIDSLSSLSSDAEETVHVYCCNTEYTRYANLKINIDK